MHLTQAERRTLKNNNRKQPAKLTMVEESEWPKQTQETYPFAVWRSRTLSVQGYVEKDNVIRLSVHRTMMGKNGRWKQGLTWDELNQAKEECGFATMWAVELFPPTQHIVNDANMRHLWLIPPPNFGWRNT